MVHSELQELLALYALGTLAEPERSEVRVHLGAGCLTCTRELERYEDTAAVIARATCRVEAPSRVRARLRERVESAARPATGSAAHEELEALAALYALGSLDEDARGRFEAHLEQGCERCRLRLEREERSAADLARAAARQAPPVGVADRLKDLVWSRIGGGGEAEAPAAPPARPAGVAGRGRPDSASARASLFVGRRPERSVLQGRLEDLWRGEGAFVSLEGEAGLGKSRLIEEALAAPVAGRFEVCYLRCGAVQERTGYGPFVELLATWAGWDAESDAEVRRRAVESMVSEAVGPDERGEVFPAVARMMGLEAGEDYAQATAGISGAALERRIHEAMQTLLAARCARQPLVLVVEDLHWADPSSVSLLESLLVLIGNHRLLILAAFRPGHDSTSERVVRRADQTFRLRHHRVRLAPLDHPQMLRMARNLFACEELPAEVAALIESRGEGNPFFVQEIVRTLLDSGAVDATDGRQRIRQPLASLEQSATLDQFVLARVARLTSETRGVLEAASVMGRHVYRRVLEEVLGPDAKLDRPLAELQDARFLRRVQSHRTESLKVRTLSAETGFAFEHAIIQESVLQSLGPERRRRLHARCTEAIEKIYAHRLHDFYAVLAYHASNAEDWAKANAYLLRAGEAAAASAASAEALHFFREGYRLYRMLHGGARDRETEARLERNIALALLNVGNLEECIEHFDASLRLYGEWVPRTGWPMRWKFAIDLPAVLAGLYLGSFGKAKRACTARDRALFELMYNRCRAQNIADDERRMFDNIAAIRHVGHLDPETVENSAGILASAGAFFAFSGLSFGPSHRFLRIAERVAAAGDRGDRFLYKAMAFVVHFFEGDWSERHDIEDEEFQYGLRRGLLWDADVYLGMNCERNIHQGRYERAERQNRLCGELCERWGYEFARSNQLGTAAHLFVARRELEQAHEAATRWYEARNEDQIHLLASSLLAKIETLRGETARAAEALERAESVLARGRGVAFPFYSGAFLLARLLFDLSGLEQLEAAGERPSASEARHARRSCRRAIVSAGKIARDRTETLRLAARLHWLVGRHAQARRFWQRALESGESLGQRAELARCFRDLWRSLATARTGERSFAGLEAAEWLLKAREAFAQLGAVQELAEIEELESRVRAA